MQRIHWSLLTFAGEDSGTFDTTITDRDRALSELVRELSQRYPGLDINTRLKFSVDAPDVEGFIERYGTGEVIPFDPDQLLADPTRFEYRLSDQRVAELAERAYGAFSSHMRSMDQLYPHYRDFPDFTPWDELRGYREGWKAAVRAVLASGMKPDTPYPFPASDPDTTSDAVSEK